MLNLRINNPIFEACLWIALFTAFCIAVDLALLVSLPRLRLSFGPIGMPILIFSFGRIALFGLAVYLFTRASSLSSLEIHRFTVLTCLLQFTLTILAIYGLYVEPFNLGVTEVHLDSVQFFPDRPLRILQISDLHVEQITSREREVIAQAELLQPDLIVLTGDYLNLDYNTDPVTIRDARLILSRLHAPLGVYAIPGSPIVDRPDSMALLFDGLPIRVLNGEVEKIHLPVSDIYLIGIPVGAGETDTLKQCVASLPTGAYKLLLYHTPDLVDEAALVGVDLYLAGHTHGGQVRIPVYGALVTSSKYWKRYESGQYTLGKMTVYISRGIGMEGLQLPRIRFLAPPELVLIELGK